MTETMPSSVIVAELFYAGRWIGRGRAQALVHVSKIVEGERNMNSPDTFNLSHFWEGVEGSGVLPDCVGSHRGRPWRAKLLCCRGPGRRKSRGRNLGDSGEGGWACRSEGGALGVEEEEEKGEKSG